MLSRIIIIGNVFCALMALSFTEINAQSRPEALQAASWNIGYIIPYSTFMNDVEQGKVRQADFKGSRVDVRFKDGKTVSTYVPKGERPVTHLLKHKVVVMAHSAEEAPSVAAIFATWLPYLIYIFSLWLFVARPLWRIALRLEQLRFPGEPSGSAGNTVKDQHG